MRACLVVCVFVWTAACVADGLGMTMSATISRREPPSAVLLRVQAMHNNHCMRPPDVQDHATPPISKAETPSAVLGRVSAMHIRHLGVCVLGECDWACEARADATSVVNRAPRVYTPPEAYRPCGRGFSNSLPPAWATNT